MHLFMHIKHISALKEILKPKFYFSALRNLGVQKNANSTNPTTFCIEWMVITSKHLSSLPCIQQLGRALPLSWWVVFLSFIFQTGTTNCAFIPKVDYFSTKIILFIITKLERKYGFSMSKLLLNKIKICPSSRRPGKETQFYRQE